jgi:ParB family chromosome partitioning protein
MSLRVKEPRLGRGLAALLGDTTTGDQGSVESVAIDLLEPGPFQPRGRVDDVALGDLTESVRARGILQPLLVRRHPDRHDRFQIIAGERRWRAAQAAGLHVVPALVRDLADGEAMAASLVENLQRQDLNAIEEAEGYRRLMSEFSMTQDTLATAIGKSRSHVANTLRLLNLPEGVQANLRDGKLSAGHARALLAHPDPALASVIVLARGLSVRQTEALAARAVEERATIGSAAALPPDGASQELRDLESGLTERLGMRVTIRADGAGGRLQISYRTLDQLDSLLRLLGS